MLTAFQVLTQSSEGGCYIPCRAGSHPGMGQRHQAKCREQAGCGSRQDGGSRQDLGRRQGTTWAWDLKWVGAAPVFSFPPVNTGVSSSISHVSAVMWGMKGSQLPRVSTLSKGHDPVVTTPSQGKGGAGAELKGQERVD